jgi:hypothetical protein
MNALVELDYILSNVYDDLDQFFSTYFDTQVLSKRLPPSAGSNPSTV